jgi:hypothetical protein
MNVHKTMIKIEGIVYCEENVIHTGSETRSTNEA